MNKKLPIELAVGVIILIAIFLAIGFWLGSGSSSKSVDLMEEIPIQLKENKAQGEVNNLAWKTYRNDEYGLEFEYPEDLDIEEMFNPSKKHSSRFGVIFTETQENIKNETKENTEGGVCGSLVCVEDVEYQFNMLARTKECPYSKSFQEEIKKSYNLSSGGIDHINSVSGIFNNKLQFCLLKTIGDFGYDVSLENIYYKISFLSNDKLYIIRFQVFPNENYQDMYDSDLFDNFMDDPIAQKNIKTYDAIISTLKFIK